MSVKIIIDSTADIIPSVKHRVYTVPMVINFNGKEYIDGITINHQQFYELLINSEDTPSTSQATPAAFAKIFEQALTEGDSAVVITLASNLSGTYQSAVIAASDYENIYVVDSSSVTLGSGILAQYALMLADEGLDAKEIAQRLETEKGKISIVAMVDTLEYLKRGGRVSKTVAFAGGLLNIKPIIAVENGEIKMLGKARGSKQGYSMLLNEISSAGSINYDRPLLLGYTGNDSTLLKSFISDSKDFFETPNGQLNTTIIGSVIGTHAGPGAIAVGFFKK